MTENKREIKDVFYLMALQGLNYVAPLIVFPYLMKVLGAEKFGYIGFSLSVTQYLMLIVDFGFNLSATKRVALAKGNKEELNSIFSATMWAKMGLLAASFFVLLLLAFAVPRFSVYSSTMLIMFLMVVANAFSFVWLFQGLGEIRVVSVINAVSKLMILPLTFIFVKSPNDVNLAAFIQSMVYVLGSVITVSVLARRKYIAKWVRSTKNQIRAELKSAYPIFLSVAATSVYTTLFTIILGYFSSPAEVGKYAAVEKIMRSLCYLIFVPISQVFYPKISQIAGIDKALAVRGVNRILAITVSLVIVVAISMFWGSPIAVRFLGNDYVGSELLFRLMAFIPLFIATGGIVGQLGLLAVGDEHDKKYFQRTYFTVGVIAVVSIFVLTPQMGSVGAAISLLITELLVALLMLRGWMKICKNKN